MLKIISPLPEDINAVLKFMNSCDISEYGEADSSLVELEEQWNDIDLKKDAWILSDQRKICGYGCRSGEADRQYLELYINHAFTPADWADRLTKAAIERIEESEPHGKNGESGLVTAYASSENTLLNEILLNNGFKLHIYQFRMQIIFTAPVEPVHWPAGFEVKPFQPDDEVELYELIKSTFDWMDHVMPPIEDWRKHLFRGGQFDPEHFIIVRQSGELVGAALGYNENPLGWIRQLAVSKKLQGQGIGAMLLRHAFQVFQSKGLKKAALGVASVNQNAIGFYERCGMELVRKYAEYQRKL
jgi:ribosomal protein S18 acetylase RimI-like enzyme